MERFAAQSMCLVPLILISFYICPALGNVYLVRPDGQGDFATIQEAVDGVNDGAVILLADGVFTGDGNRNVDFHGKAITIRSQSGDPTVCIIDIEGAHNGIPEQGFLFQNGEGPESILADLTIRNGNADGG